MTREEERDYVHFMSDPGNSHECDRCHANEERGGDVLPCGQHHCWVDVTADSRKGGRIKYTDGGVPVKVAARVLGMAPETVRQRMADGVLDIGIAFIPVRRGRGRGRKNRSFYISPKKFYELTGYEWKGEENETDKEA